MAKNALVCSTVTTGLDNIILTHRTICENIRGLEHVVSTAFSLCPHLLSPFVTGGIFLVKVTLNRRILDLLSSNWLLLVSEAVFSPSLVSSCVYWDAAETGKLIGLLNSTAN